MKLFLLFLVIGGLFGAVSISEIYNNKGANMWQKGTVASPVFYEVDESTAIIVSCTYWQIFAVNATSGETLWLHNTWSVPNPIVNSRFEAGIVMVKDFYEQGDVVFIVGTDKSMVSSFDKDGNLLRKHTIIPNWTRKVTSILVGKTDPALPWTVIVGLPTTDISESIGRYPNTWFLDPYFQEQTGTGPRPVFKSQEAQNTLGVFGKNHALYDLNNNSYLETIVPSDDYAVSIWDHGGKQWPVDPVFYNANNFWSNVIFSKNYTYEYRGWAGSNHDQKPFFAHGIATVVPVKNQDEPVIAISGLYSSGFDHSGPVTDDYHSIFVLNPNRTRANSWELSFDHCQPYYNVTNMPMIQINIAYADLTGNGEQELIFPCSDGKVYAVELKNGQNIPYSWPYNLSSTYTKPRFASEVVIFQKSGQRPHVAFVTYGPETEGFRSYNGSFIVLDYQGILVNEVILPLPRLDESYVFNGAVGGITLFRYSNNAEMSGNNNLFAAIQTTFSGLCVYELLDTADATILWQTARGNFHRDGNPPSEKNYPFVKPTLRTTPTPPSFPDVKGNKVGGKTGYGGDAFGITFAVLFVVVGSFLSCIVLFCVVCGGIGLIGLLVCCGLGLAGYFCYDAVRPKTIMVPAARAAPKSQNEMKDKV